MLSCLKLACTYSSWQVQRMLVHIHIGQQRAINGIDNC
jgi:hypothetical protein